MMSKPILSDIVDMLKNSQFCQDAEKIHLNSGQILSCQEFVPTFIPMALEVLFTLEKSEIANICNLVFGVCWFEKYIKYKKKEYIRYLYIMGKWAFFLVFQIQDISQSNIIIF